MRAPCNIFLWSGQSDFVRPHTRFDRFFLEGFVACLTVASAPGFGALVDLRHGGWHRGSRRAPRRVAKMAAKMALFDQAEGGSVRRVKEDQG